MDIELIRRKASEGYGWAKLLLRKVEQGNQTTDNCTPDNTYNNNDKDKSLLNNKPQSNKATRNRFVALRMTSDLFNKINARQGESISSKIRAILKEYLKNEGK